MDFAKNINKKQENLRKAKRGDGVYASLLGSKQRSYDLATIWEQYCVDLEFISAIKLMEYAESGLYTPQELQAFKLGLSAIPSFLISNYKECNPLPKKNL